MRRRAPRTRRAARRGSRPCVGCGGGRRPRRGQPRTRLRVGQGAEQVLLRYKRAANDRKRDVGSAEGSCWLMQAVWKGSGGRKLECQA